MFRDNFVSNHINSIRKYNLRRQNRIQFLSAITRAKTVNLKLIIVVFF